MNKYDEQAKAFIDRFGLEVKIEAAAMVPPPWHEKGKDHGLHYAVTISHSGRKHLTFDYWGSLVDREKRVAPKPYDVLACISGNVNCPDTFEEFCGEFGFDEDSRKAERQFAMCTDFAARLKRFFTDDELDALAEIQ